MGGAKGDRIRCPMQIVYNWALDHHPPGQKTTRNRKGIHPIPGATPTNIAATLVRQSEFSQRGLIRSNCWCPGHRSLAQMHEMSSRHDVVSTRGRPNAVRMTRVRARQAHLTTAHKQPMSAPRSLVRFGNHREQRMA